MISRWNALPFALVLTTAVLFVGRELVPISAALSVRPARQGAALNPSRSDVLRRQASRLEEARARLAARPLEGETALKVAAQVNALAGTTPNAQVAACSRQLKTIHRALTAYERRHGRLPAELSELYPRDLKERQLLHCPADRTPGQPGLIWVPRDRRFPVSYFYHTSLDRWNPYDTLLGPRPACTSPPSRETVLATQRLYFGERVPVLRCLHHSGVLYLTRAGTVYRARIFWAYEAEPVRSVVRSLERDLSAGVGSFRERWSPSLVADYFIDATRLHRPFPVPRERLIGAARRLETRVAAHPVTERRGVIAAAGSLRLAAGDLDGVLAAYRAVLLQPQDTRSLPFRWTERVADVLSQAVRDRRAPLGDVPRIRSHAGRMLAEIEQFPEPARVGVAAAAGDLYRATGDREAAIAAYERTLALQNAGSVPAHDVKYHLVGHYLETRRYAKAIPLLEAMRAAMPRSRAVLGWMAQAYEGLGEKEKAAEFRLQADPGMRLVGGPALDFTLTDAAGKRVRLSELRGKVVLLNFWGLG